MQHGFEPPDARDRIRAAGHDPQQRTYSFHRGHRVTGARHAFPSGIGESGALLCGSQGWVPFTTLVLRHPRTGLGVAQADQTGRRRPESEALLTFWLNYGRGVIPSLRQAGRKVSASRLQRRQAADLTAGFDLVWIHRSTSSSYIRQGFP